MAVQQEIKSQLAKLLATEDIVVEHKQVECAQFNVRTRVLILPLWEKASHDVYDMLVGHEVGHALFTPDEDWWMDHDIPQQFVNVVEDARIEKLMKRKYLGLAKSFYKGYSELHYKDFFELDGQDINSFNLADRANLHFKLSSILSISFSSTEKPIIDLIHDCETFTDTLSAAEALYNFCKQEQEKESKEEEGDWMDQLVDSQGTHNITGSSDGDNTPPVSDTPSSDAMEDRSSNSVSNPGVDDSDVTVGTADALESKLRDLVNEKGIENTYVEIPQVNLDTIIAKNCEIHEEIDRCFAYQQKEYDITAEEHGMVAVNLYEEVDNELVKLKKDAQREVSYLVKEFECKKAASAYARTSVSKTGVLDTQALSSYKFSEDLFKKITVLPDGKNHGLVFLLDWSGSMQYVLQDTCKQLFNLIWFCRKVGIPFEVYAFTNEWNRNKKDYETGEYKPANIQIHYKKKEGVFVVDESFNLMNLLTSKVNSKILEHQMMNIWRLATCFRTPLRYTYPSCLSLSATPLNEALICLHQILPQFRKDNNLEKVQCIVLTDGETNPLPFHKEVKRNWESKPYLGCRNIKADRCFLRDRKCGKIYNFKWNWFEFTDVLLENLKDRFPTVNFIGIRVLVPRDAKGFMRLYNENLESEWKKNKSFIIKKSGYDAYFGISSNNLSQDAEFDVDEDATKAQIKRAFVKSLKTKKLNKKVLGEFISLVV